MSWFEVDRAGLRQLWGDKDKRFLLFELIANSLDEPGVTKCHVRVFPIPGKRQVQIRVEDDAPEGFVDLKHAYTLFAHTRKRGKAGVRGRFNVGEKHVLCLAETATIATTTGTVTFGPGGRHLSKRIKLDKGSIVDLTVKLTKAELAGLLEAARTIIPPRGIELTLNGLEIESRKPLKKFKTTLATELEDENGSFRATKRSTEVKLYSPKPHEMAMLFELGIPVMPIEDKWHVDVQQKVPLTIERDNVRPAFLRDVRAEILNRMAGLLSDNEVGEKWVRDGMSDERIKPEAVNTIADKRWGENRCVIAPGDSYSREQAILNDYTIVNPREASREEWEQIRGAGSVLSGGEIWKRDDVPCEIIPGNKWTAGMERIAKLTVKVASLMGFDVGIEMIRSPEATIDADYKDRVVRFNVSNLGKTWFSRPRHKVLPLIIHELGHEYGGHLDASYLDGICRIGARLAITDTAELGNEVDREVV